MKTKNLSFGTDGQTIGKSLWTLLLYMNAIVRLLYAQRCKKLAMEQWLMKMMELVEIAH